MPTWSVTGICAVSSVELLRIIIDTTEMEDVLKKEFRKRISIVGLQQVKGDGSHGTTVVFMSFHNVHNDYNREELQRFSEIFCQIVSEISEKTKSTVIAGADLNCRLAPGDHNGATVETVGHTATQRRQDKIIDHFIIAQQGNNATTCTATALDLVETGKDDTLHQLMLMMKVDPYLKASMKGLGVQKDQDELRGKMSKALDNGYYPILNEALQAALTDGLAVQVDTAMQTASVKHLDPNLRRVLKTGLKDILSKPLADALDKALNVNFDKEVNKALDHDPILLEPERGT